MFGVVTGAAVVLAACLLGWLVRPSPSHIPGAVSVRQYLDVKACLLTGSGGVSDGSAAAAWAGLRDASLATKAMVSYQPVIGPATGSAALPYLASLAQRQCRVIVAVDTGPVAAAVSDAARFGQIRFLVIAARRSSANVTAIPPAPAAQLRTAVRAAVIAAAQ